MRLPRTVTAGAIITALGIALGLLFALRAFGGEPSASAGLQPLLTAADGSLVVYSEFGQDADTLWAANPDDPARRTALATVSHAPGYGILPALSPDGKRIAYTVLPPNGPAAPDAPAELRTLDVASGETTVLASDVDLPVPPVWSATADAVVVRRSAWDDASGSGTFALVRVDLGGNAATVATSSAGLFPIDFSPDGASLYYTALSPAGTDLWRVDAGGATAVAHLSDGFARDWHLSPDGMQLAYLAQSNDTNVAYTARVLDLESGVAGEPVGGDVAQFSPVWERPGVLTVGTLRGAALRIAGEGGTAGSPLAAPTTGFDVPLGWSPSGDKLAVRSFAGASLADPGPSRVAVVGTDGARRVLSLNSDVVIAGWLTP